MMQFYQKRDFSTLISDTFNFFKIFGKNYFKNYFIINGLLLILMVVIFIVGYREFFMQLFGANTAGQNYYFEQYFQENEVFLILLVIALFALMMFVTVISYSFPIFYLKRVSVSQKPDVKADDILSDLKQNWTKIFFLFIGLVFVISPLFLIVFGISYLLMLVIIGFFLLLLIVPACINIVNFLMYDYLNTDRSFFSSLSYAIRAQFSYQNQYERSPFWKYWGSTIIIYIINYVITLIFTMIPMIVLFIYFYTFPTDGKFQQNPFDGAFGLLFFVIYGVSLLVSFVLMNVLLVNSGLMYFDSRTDIHQKIDLKEIDTIGNNEE